MQMLEWALSQQPNGYVESRGRSPRLKLREPQASVETRGRSPRLKLREQSDRLKLGSNATA